MNMKYYLAYGSNLNKEQMATRCPDAVPVGSCVVNDFDLVFRGVATIEPKKGASVQAGIWEISETDEKALDIYEGFPWLYTKRTLTVELDGKPIRAMVYIMNRVGRPRSNPSTWYLRTIMEGYRDFKLDDKSLTIAAAKV